MCQAVFGMSQEEIDELLPVFHDCLIAHRYELKPHRQRKVGGGRKGDLPTDKDKLLFLLMYLKIYPTYDALSVLCDHARSKCGDSVQLLLPVLEKTLGRRLSLPARKPESLEKIFARHPEIKDVFIDGTERPVQKPKNQKRRKKLYSGKKKGTMRKNVLISNEKRGILFLSKTKSGRRHDKRLFDKNHLARSIPKHVTAWTDTGLKGIESLHPNTQMPRKATKNQPLTEEDKQNNRIISGLRILSEHANAGLKRMKAATDIYRNRLANMDDRMTLVCVGLWNFHLGQTI
jgi:hypothetical protein